MEKEEDVSGCNREASHLNHILEARLLSGFYSSRRIRYDPVADNQLSQVQAYQLKKAGVPVELIEPWWPA